MDFTKKFNIGLTLNTNLKEFEEFLKKYHGYIRSFYFSPPINKYFHTRKKVAYAFMLPGKKKLFWQMLELIKSYGVELELLLNTLVLDDELIEQAADLMQEKGVTVDSVCFLTRYYDSAVKYFPSAKRILSFNNGFMTEKAIDSAIEKFEFDAMVLGSAFIRDNELFGRLRDKGIEVYLLLNNGCSFNCGTCNNVSSDCKKSFENNLKKHSAEYLYALQSIFPYELAEGIIDTTRVTCLKISNRCSDIRFVSEAMDSYINNEVAYYVGKSKNSYAYWGRAGFFWKYFRKFNLDSVEKIKKEILAGKQSE